MTGVDGRVAIVGGSSSGLGYAVAELLARSSARVMVVSRSEERVSKAVDGIRAAGGKTVEGFAADFTDEGAPAAVVAATRDAFGPPDIVVTNSGGPPGMPAVEATANDLQAASELLLLPVQRFAELTLPAMREAGAGSIVNISSLAGLRGGTGAFAYHSAKWAVRGMTKAAAVENGRRNVRVNSIHPGLIDTDMMRELPGAEDEMRLTRRVPLGRAAQADEVAQLALYLASDASSYSTGSEFIVDGGLNAL